MGLRQILARQFVRRSQIDSVRLPDGITDLYAYRLADLKNTKGYPVEISYTDPTPAAPSPLVVAKKSPRPYAAALLMDYLLSEPAQKFSRSSADLGSPRRTAHLSGPRHGGQRCAGIASDSRRRCGVGEALPATARGVLAEKVSARGRVTLRVDTTIAERAAQLKAAQEQAARAARARTAQQPAERVTPPGVYQAR